MLNKKYFYIIYIYIEKSYIFAHKIESIYEYIWFNN